MTSIGLKRKSLTIGLLAFVAFCICISKSTHAQIHNLETRPITNVLGKPDTINGLAGMITSGTNLKLIFSAQTESEWKQFTAALRLYSPDGSVDSLELVSGPTILPAWSEAGMSLLGGFQIQNDFDIELPENFFVAWAVFTGSGFNSPQLADVFSVTFHIPDDAEGILCIDTALYGSSGQTLVQGDFGSEIPMWGASGGGYPDGGLCYSVSPSVNCCDLAGDADNSGIVNIADVTSLLQIIFGGYTSSCCTEADANGDGALQIVDVVYLINRIFTGGPAPICGPAIVECRIQ